MVFILFLREKKIKSTCIFLFFLLHQRIKIVFHLIYRVNSFFGKNIWFLTRLYERESWVQIKWIVWIVKEIEVKLKNSIIKFAFVEVFPLNLSNKTKQSQKWGWFWWIDRQFKHVRWISSITITRICSCRIWLCMYLKDTCWN